MRILAALAARFSVFLISFFAAGAALAQAYPNRPVRVVVPWPPGQATDIAARVVAQKLQESFSQAFVIENKPGAGGAIGSDIVAKSPADGYTLLAASSGPLSIMPNLQKIPYDPLKDFAPVSMVAVTPFALVTHPSFPAANAKEFVALSPADGYTLLAASSGPLSIMPNLQKIPYDPLKDFAPVSMVAVTPFALVTHPSFPAANAKEFVALSPADGYTLLAASSGPLSIMPNLQKIPY